VSAKGLDERLPGEGDEASHYFLNILPRIKQRHFRTSSSSSSIPDMRIIEFIQEAGQTVFVPGGWWHGVLNLTNTVAVTQVLTPAGFVQPT
jgi:histone arginine demethylase JMJD6